MKKICFVATFVSLVLGSASNAAPISVDAFGDNFEVFHFRDFRGPNSVGFTEGDRLTFGAVNVVPNDKGENNGVVVSGFPTTGVARQNGIQVNLTGFSTTVNPNQFAGAVDYDPALTGSWEFEFRNGPDTLIVNSPSVGSAASLPIVNNLQFVGGTPTTPTFQWDDPGPVDRTVVSIFDLNQVGNSSGSANRIFVSGVNGTSFSVPNGILSADGRYAFAVEPSLSRTSGTNPSGSSQAGSSLTRSRTFFEFWTGATPLPPGTFLPQVSVSSGTPVFNFNNPVIQNQISFYDPVFAVGYDYLIGAGNPLFNSVVLPDVGDSIFELFLWNGSDYVFDQFVAANTELTFGGGGVDRFRILGIETSAGLDPNDPTAFVTGLSFVADGQFTGTMTPILLEVPATIPLPASAVLLAFGFASFGLLRRSRKSIC